MKGIVTINFKRIGKEKVDNKLIEKNPKLFETTEKTILILCQQITNYFKDHKIKVKVKGELYE
jgi:hypothetical protein